MIVRREILDSAADFQQVNNLKKYYGKYPGVVLDNDAQKGGHRGELKVEVYGILEESSDGESHRPYQDIAKPCFPPGFFFVPEIGDNIWVEFAAGDINTPIWTGVWYPKDKTPYNTEEEAPTRFQKVIRTDSGNVVQLDDSEGAEKIIITHNSGSNVMIDNDSISIGHNSDSNVMIDDDNIIIVHKKGSKIEIGRDGDITIESKKITLKGGDILLGGEAKEPLVLGKQLIQSLKNIFTLIENHFHLTEMGPSDTSLQLLQMTTMLGDPLSKKNTTE